MRCESSRRGGPGGLIGRALVQAVADAKLALAGPGHFLHGVNLRRLLAQRERHRGFDPGAAEKHAHGFAGRASAKPAPEIAWHFRAVNAQNSISSPTSHFRPHTP